MQRSCDACGTPYEAKRTSSKFCSTNCRIRANRSGSAQVRAVPVAVEPVPSSLVAVVERKLAAADRLESVAGAQAVQLAGRMDSEISGSALAQMHKVLQALMDRAMEGVGVAADPVDELRARRDRLRSG